MLAAGVFRLVFVFISARHYDQAEETARTAADALWPMADGGDPQAMSLWGGLTVQRTVIAARVNDPDTAYDQLERARQIAGRLGEGRNDYNTEFGPANVGLQEVAIAVDLGDAGRALRAAATVHTSGLSSERRARDAHRGGSGPRPAPSYPRSHCRAAPSRTDHSRAGPRARTGTPARLLPAHHA